MLKKTYIPHISNKWLSFGCEVLYTTKAVSARQAPVSCIYNVFGIQDILSCIPRIYLVCKMGRAICEGKEAKLYTKLLSGSEALAMRTRQEVCTRHRRSCVQEGASILQYNIVLYTRRPTDGTISLVSRQSHCCHVMAASSELTNRMWSDC